MRDKFAINVEEMGNLIDFQHYKTVETFKAMVLETIPAYSEAEAEAMAIGVVGTREYWIDKTRKAAKLQLSILGLLGAAVVIIKLARR